MQGCTCIAIEQTRLSLPQPAAAGRPMSGSTASGMLCTVHLTWPLAFCGRDGPQYVPSP